MDGLTAEQIALADRRAQCAVAAADAQAARAGDGFVSIRGLNQAAKQVGTPEPDWRAERDMVRAAGFGRFKTGAVLGDWGSMVDAAYEAARFYKEPIDMIAVSRHSLAWCLAGRPVDHPLRAVMKDSRDITTDDVHRETTRPSYRQVLDGWKRILTP